MLIINYFSLHISFQFGTLHNLASSRSVTEQVLIVIWKYVMNMQQSPL